MLLTDEERKKFAAWCELEAKGCDALAEQMAKLPVPADLVRMYRATAAAARHIARRLIDVEMQEVSGGT